MIEIEALRQRLVEANQRLAGLTGGEPAELSFQTGESRADMLFLYGVLGGKDVGKTSLINRLAGARISIDSDRLDEGTKTCVAYCHRGDLDALKGRLQVELQGGIRFVEHDRDELQNVVLIDLPDFDSRFDAHLEDVRRLGPLLQGVVWVTSPRKYADHEFLDRFELAAQSHENLYLVLNKVDQLDGKAELEEIRQEVMSTIRYGCERAGVPAIANERLWLVSALHPERYEFQTLYERLIRVHSAEEIARAKAENLRSEFEKNIQRLRRRYRLDERIRELDDALEFIRSEAAERFGEELFAAVRQRVMSLEPVNRRIGAGVFYQRIDRWPILRSLFYPLSGLVSFIGGRFAFTPKSSDWAESPLDLLRFEGRSATARMLELHDALDARFPQAANEPLPADELGLWLERRLNRLLRLYEDRVVEQMNETTQAPGTAIKSLVYLPLVWFPFIQPVLLHWSQREENFFSLAGLQDNISLLISLLGAGALLQSLIFLLLFYFIWLMALYARGTRRMMETGQSVLYDIWYEEWLPSIVSRFETPLANARARWIDSLTQIESIETDIDAELNRLTG